MHPKVGIKNLSAIPVVKLLMDNYVNDDELCLTHHRAPRTVNEDFVGHETIDVENPDEKMDNGFINTPKSNSDDRTVGASNANVDLEGY